MNGIWVGVLLDPVYLALRQAICAPCSVTKLEEPCSFSKFPDGPYI